MIAKKVVRKQASRLRLKPVTRYLQRVEEESCEEASVASAIETSLDIGDLRLQQSCEEASVASAIETHGKHGNGRTIHFVARKQASRLRLKLTANMATCAPSTSLRGSKRRVCD